MPVDAAPRLTQAQPKEATIPPLTDLRIRSLPFEDGQRDYPDKDGLFLRVGKCTKTFMLTIRKGNSRQRVSLGHYPSLSLSKARTKSADLRAEARMRKSEPHALTFKEALEQFLRLHVPTQRRLTQRECTRILTTRFTALEPRRLTDLKTSELATLLDGIQAPSEKRNAFVWLRVFLNWCYQRGYLDMNPISRIKSIKASPSRDRVLSDLELVKVWNASYELNSGEYGALVRLCILTGQRRGQWQQFRPEFLEAETITWPASVMKGNKPHTIPLTDLIKREIGNHTFKGWNEDYQKRSLDRLAGIPHFTIHDLRRTVATHLAELGIAPHIIEHLLAHATGTAISRTYNRATYLPEMRAALIRWEERLLSLVA